MGHTTPELTRRAARPRDTVAERQALTLLAHEAIRSPQTLLKTIAETALRLCRAHSAGVSILEEADAQPVVRWHAATGQWTGLEGGTMRREASPCGVALDQNAPVLVGRPDRDYAYPPGSRLPIEEALLVPFHVDGTAVGTVWVMSHDDSVSFDSEDARVLSTLADLAATAHRWQAQTQEHASDVRRSLDGRPETHEDRQARSLAAGQKDALELAVSGAPLHAILRVLADAARQQVGPGARAAMFIRDPDGGCLRFGASVDLPVGFTRLFDGAAIGPLSPSCGLAAYTAQTVIVRDVRHDPLWAPHLPLAEAHGIRACWSFPITTFSGHVLGTLALYHAEPCVPLPQELEAVRVLAHTASLVLERHRVTEERNRAEEQVLGLADDLRRRLAEQETLLRVVPVGVFIAHDAACTQITVNPAGAAMLRIPQSLNASKSGASRDRLPFRVFQQGVEVPAEELPMQRSARQGEVVTGEEYEVVFSDGSAITLLEHASPFFDASGQVRGCVGVFVDITARKQNEEALRLSEERLQQVDRRKDHFLATLAHELRNPLAPVRTGLQLIRLAGDTPGAVEQVRSTMERQIGHMVRLIDDLLDISRITSGAISLRRALTPLAELVQSAVDANEGILADAGVQLTIELPAAPCELDVDPTRFVQVLSNLLHNAAKFTPANGHVTVTGRRVTGEGRADELVLAVADTGVGITADLLPSVFDLFAQGERRSLQAHGGLGIGLSLARQLIQLHGGSIEARSEGPGCGSTFTVRMPLAGAPARPPAPALMSAGERVTRRRVLIVDDNADAAQMLAMLVRTMGGDARTATNGASGIRLARRFAPDLILLDIGMPGIDGYETCRRLRREPFGPSVSIVALTGWGQEQDKQRAAEAGFDLHLTKPADPALLERLLAGEAERAARSMEPPWS